MGVASEAVLAELCQRSFLSLWSYPNPYNDKGLAQRKEGKELCDLLVIFGNDVIIFSDKSCAYPNTGDEALDWKRWYKRAVEESIDQIVGAERWLREHPGRVFADNRCTKPLDARIPNSSEMRVHRVVVALGARARCRAYFGGGSGSLPIMAGGPPETLEAQRTLFRLGNDGGSRGFVHVLDDVGLHVVLRELDTAADFVQYLSRKEDLCTNAAVVATGEEDLLAHYLMTMDGEEHAFLPSDQTAQGANRRCLAVDETAFETLVTLPQYRESKRANQPSYIWDRLIEHFTKYFRNDELLPGVEALTFERALRVMASPSRLIRRQLGRMTETALLTTDFGSGSEGIRYTSVVDTSDGGKLAYAVVCKPARGDIPYDVYRHRRQLQMELYARAIRVRVNTVERVLVVGLQPASDAGGSEDLALFDLPEWTAELDVQTRRDMEMFGLRVQPRYHREHEFPEAGRHQGKREAERRRRQMERLRAKKKSDK